MTTTGGAGMSVQSSEVLVQRESETTGDAAGLQEYSRLARNPLTRREGLAGLLKRLPSSISALLELIHVTDEIVEIRLADAFRMHSGTAAQLLESLTVHARTAQSLRALYYLTAMMTPEADEAIARLVLHWDRPVRRRAIRAVADNRITRATPMLIRASEDYEWEIREEAARALGYVADSSCWTSLALLLEDDWVSVRRQAAKALGYLHSTEAVPALMHALRDHDGRVRFLAYGSVRQIAEAFPDEVIVSLATSCNEDAVALAAELLAELEVEPELVLSWLDQRLDGEQMLMAWNRLSSTCGPTVVVSAAVLCGEEMPWVIDWVVDAVGSADTGELAHLAALPHGSTFLSDLLEQQRGDWEQLGEALEARGVGENELARWHSTVELRR